MNYTFTLHVNDVQPFLPCTPLGGFGCVTIADDYTGTFSTSGTVVNDLLLRIGNVVYDQLHPYPLSDLFTFRDGTGGFGASLEFIDNTLHGGLVGTGDIPFIDFPPIVGTGFQAFDGSTYFTGAVTVTQAIEPATTLLLFAALILSWLFKGKCNDEKSPARIHRTPH